MSDSSGKPTPAGPAPRGFFTPGGNRAGVQARIDAMRREILAAERKRNGIDAAITSRRSTLNRLQAQLAIYEHGTVPSQNGL